MSANRDILLPLQDSSSDDAEDPDYQDAPGELDDDEFFGM